MQLLLIGSLLVVGGATAHSPVAIRTSPPSAPIETAGTGLEPEVAVRLSIDERGRVTGVTVLGITPASDHDDAFRAAAERTLLEWRYAPVIVEGLPAPAQFETKVRFLPPATSVVTPEVHLELMRMGREQRASHLESEGARARKHLVGERTRKFSTARFVVYTDATSPGMARTLAETCEAVSGALDRLLARQVPPEPEPYKVVALAYGELDDYEKVTYRNEGREHAQGFYYPAGLIGFHLERPSIQNAIATLVHLATHAYLDRYIARPGILLPSWLAEGFADYVASSEVREGLLVPDLTELRQAIGRGDAIPLEKLLSGKAEDLAAGHRRMYYAESWALVHFLLHGGEHWAEERFPRLVLYLAEGYPSAEAFREVYGDPRELEATFRTYLARL